MLQFRYKSSPYDVFIALFLAQVSPPTCFILIAVFFLNLYRSFWPFLQEGYYFWFALSMLVQFLLLAVISLLVSFVFVYGGSLLGLYKLSLSEQEITLEEDSYRTKIGDTETKTSIQNFLKFIETRKRIILIRSGLSATVIHKRFLSQEALGDFRRIFASKASPKTQWYCKNFAYITLALALIVGVGGSLPQYTLRLTSGKPEAFWKGDKLYVSIQVVPEGFVDYFYWDLFPILRNPSSFSMPSLQLNLFEVSAGKLRKFQLQEEPFTQGGFYPMDDSIYYVGFGRKKSSKVMILKDNGFEPVTGMMTDDLRKKQFNAFSEGGGWKTLGLWDENGEEEPDLNQRNQDYTATFHLAGGDVKLDYNRKILDEKMGVEENTYQLEGLTGQSAPELLADIKSDMSQIDKATYMKYYPLAGKKIDLKGLEE